MQPPEQAALKILGLDADPTDFAPSPARCARTSQSREALLAKYAGIRTTTHAGCSRGASASCPPPGLCDTTSGAAFVGRRPFCSSVAMTGPPYPGMRYEPQYSRVHALSSC